MKRRQARDVAFKLIYQMDIRSCEPQEVLDIYFETNESEPDPYIIETVTGVFDYMAEIDALISENLKNWRIERVSKVNLAIIRLCVFEMLHAEGIPAVIAINEAVELAKRYDDGEVSGKFVNGVVNKIKEVTKSE